MKYSVPALLTTVFLFMSVAFISAQDRVCYTGTELSNPYRHDGQLSPAVGVHNIQLLRANRDSITATYNFGWTYNHQPMMCYWNGKFYLHFLCDSTDEHIPPSRTVLMTSPDGYHWSSPEILFPEYKVPEGFTKKGRTDTVTQPYSHHAPACRLLRGIERTVIGHWQLRYCSRQKRRSQ